MQEREKKWNEYDYIRKNWEEKEQRIEREREPDMEQ